MGIIQRKEENQTLIKTETWTGLDGKNPTSVVEDAVKTESVAKLEKEMTSNPENVQAEVTRRDFVVIAVVIIAVLIVIAWLKIK